jgi:proteasomal ATPase-associated factor 1
MTSHITLPILTVQSDFPDVIAEVDAGLVPVDSFWLSCYKSGESSVHAKILATLDDVDRNLIRFTPKDGDVNFVKTLNVSSLSDIIYTSSHDNKGLHRCL